MSGRSMRAGRANRRRGEVEGRIGGERRILCLTLGALAELETAFAVDNLADLARRFSQGRLSARDITRVLAAGLRGGGNAFAEEDVAMMELDEGLDGAARLVTELLAATFGPARSAEARLSETRPAGNPAGGEAAPNP